MRPLLASLVLTSSLAFAGLGGKVNTTTTFGSSVNPAVTGQEITFTATVTPASGNTVPTGTVSFTFSGSVPVQMATLDGSAHASITIPLGVTATVTAAYSGDGNFNPSTSSTLTEVVNPASTTTRLMSSLNPSVYGQTVTFTALVTLVPPAGGVPGSPALPRDIGDAPFPFLNGNVTFTISDGPTLSAPVRVLTETRARPRSFLGFPAVASISILTAGSHTVTATYDGNTQYLPSSSAPLIQVVNLAPTTTTLVSSVNPVLPGEQTMLTATVTSTGGKPTGKVTFNVSGGAPLFGTLNSSGHASVYLDTTAGTHAITATYGGDANFSQSASSPLAQVVDQIPTISTPTSSPNPSIFGQPVTLSATVSAGNFATGSVTFLDGASLIGTAPLNSLSTGVLTTSSLGIGTHNVTAIYSNNVGFKASPSGPLTQIVRGTATVTLSASNNSPAANAPFSLLASITAPVPGAPGPTGTVTFTDGTTTLGVAAIGASAEASLTLSGGLSGGTHSIAAQYSGDVFYQAATSAPLLEDVAKTVSVTSLGSYIGNNALSLAAVVRSATTGTPTGTVQFLDVTLGTVLGSNSLAVGKSTVSLSPPFPPGHTIQAIYSGDATFAGSRSAPRVLIIPVNAFSDVIEGLSPDEIVTLLGSGFAAPASQSTTARATAQQTTVALVDGAGKSHPATVLYVSPAQINFVVPSDMPMGAAQIIIDTASGVNIAVDTTVQSINPVSPGIATVGGTLAAGQFVVINPDGSQAVPTATAVYEQVNQVWKLVPPVWGANDQLYLLLYGTGFRHSPGSVSCTLGGQTITPGYAGSQMDMPGLDQINLHVPQSFRSAGTVSVTCTADGQTSNSAMVAFD